MEDTTANSIKRLFSGLIVMPLYYFCFISSSFNSILILLASLVVTLSSLYEFYRMVSVDDTKKPFFFAGMVIAILVNIVFYLYAFGTTFDGRISLFLFVLFIGGIAILQLFTRPLQNGIHSLSTTVFGVVYIVMFYSHIILLKSFNDGTYYILILHIVIMSNDIFAYIGGILFGKHKTNYPVSPNKSWEGYFSGILFSVVTMTITAYVMNSVSGKQLFGLLESILLGIVLSILGNLGDLIESAVKRDSSKKDSGSIMYGHGGMWDVFDALIFSMPFFYYYLLFKGVS
ncbi:MAG: phosphatidate cytidylyltransferase [bacterium]|nr:phosphatidate cytidylyltransferase [bacterium]